MTPRQETGPHLRLPYTVDQLRDGDAAHIEAVQRDLTNRSSGERQQIRKDAAAFLSILSSHPNLERYRSVEQALRNLQTAIDGLTNSGGETAASYVQNGLNTVLPVNEGIDGYRAMAMSTRDAWSNGNYGRLAANLGVLGVGLFAGGAAINWFWNWGEPSEEQREEEGARSLWRQPLRFLRRAVKAILITGGTLGFGWLLKSQYLKRMDSPSSTDTEARQQQLQATAELNRLAQQNRSISVTDTRLPQADLFSLQPMININGNGILFRRSAGQSARMVLQIRQTGRFEAPITEAVGITNGLRIDGKDIAESELVAKLGQATVATPITLQATNGGTLTLNFTPANS